MTAASEFGQHETQQVPVSVVIIAKNEEAHIAECLESAAWADEIVVVDDYSDDRTREIALQYTPSVYQRRMDVEGRHRNWAYAQARHRWVFSLDADERITPALRDNLRALLQTEPPCVAYSVPIRAYIGERWIQHGGWYPGYKVRLLDREKCRYEEAEVHPRFLKDGPAGIVQGDLLHYSYRGVADFVRSVNAQTDAEARKWFNERRPMSVARCLRKTVDRFLKGYLLKRGYRDGFLGLVVASFAGLYQLWSYAKYQELLEQERQGQLDPAIGRQAVSDASVEVVATSDDAT